ncbi:MAG: hypothetical protein ACI8W7_000761 [Gammaproteobacteria bacterium]|jgi:hypothetical protein
MTYHHRGRCRCAQVSLEFHSSKDLPDQSPRQCDCDYCASHGKPILLSDPDGQLLVTSSQAVTKETQGSGQAQMLFCPSCGNMLGACLENDSQIIGVVNGALLDEANRLPASQIVSPKKLSADEKRTRWPSIWTPTKIIVIS